MKIMSAYQEQKDDFEGISRIALVIRALMRIVGLSESDNWTSLDILDKSTETVKVNASQICDGIKTLLAEGSDDEGEGEDDAETESTDTARQTPRWPTPKAVGILLSKLRLSKDRDPSPGRARSRLVSQREVLQLAIAHHVVHLKSNLSTCPLVAHLMIMTRYCCDCPRVAEASVPEQRCAA